MITGHVGHVLLTTACYSVIFGILSIPLCHSTGVYCSVQQTPQCEVPVLSRNLQNDQQLLPSVVNLTRRSTALVLFGMSWEVLGVDKGGGKERHLGLRVSWAGAGALALSLVGSPGSYIGCHIRHFCLRKTICVDLVGGGIGIGEII